MEEEYECYAIQPKVYIFFDRRAREITKIINKDSMPADVVIPDELEDGTKLTKLSPKGGWIEGPFNCLRLSDGITEVERYSFLYASVEKVIWSKGCDVIPESCFAYSKICSIENINHVTYIGKNAFKKSWIENIRWPDNCQIIEEGTFEDSGFFNYLKIDNIERVTEIGASAFRHSRIRSFTVPEGVNTIHSSTFRKSICNNIILHDNITKIEDHAFSDMMITTIKWPSHCKTIPQGCFNSCKYLEHIEGISNVTRISTSAFAKCKGLESFNWPPECTTIPRTCFAECRNLEEVNIPDKVKNIKAGAFQRTGITKLKWPSSCSVIPSCCFFDSKLTNLGNIEKIEYGAFVNSRLVKADFSASLFSYEGHIFDNNARFQKGIVFPYYYDNSNIMDILCE